MKQRSAKLGGCRDDPTGRGTCPRTFTRRPRRVGMAVIPHTELVLSLCGESPADLEPFCVRQMAKP